MEKEKMENLRNMNEGSKQKERHIVTWTQQEDDILREQINTHGTENWTVIASKFNDKTTRQCRRRWYTYLNSDFKKGGWSPEEDVILCEAQKMFGNRWTEIAKVVSGRTDNAVKNRFSTLCKKRAKHEALEKENNSSYINLNNKRVLIENGLYKDTEIETETEMLFKKMRKTRISNLTENGEKTMNNQLLRPPFTLLAENFQKEEHTIKTKDVTNDVAPSNKNDCKFLKKDDPKITALVQQAELLSSLAIQVNMENSDQSLENAWKILRDFLNQTKQNDEQECNFPNTDFPLEDFKDLIEDLRSSSEGKPFNLRQPDLQQESPGGSEYSTGSTLFPSIAADRTEEAKITGEIFSVFHVPSSLNGAFPAASFSSPLQLIPQFRSLSAGIQSPKFSDSEKNYLLRTLGVEPGSLNPNVNPLQPEPPCKRALVHGL